MPTRPSHDPSRLPQQNGFRAQPNGIQNGNPADPNRVAGHVPVQNNGLLTFLAPFLGAFAAVVVLAIVGVGGYFAVQAYQGRTSSSSNGGEKNLLTDVSDWQQGKDTAANLDANDKPDIGWWTRHFDLPPEQPVIDYLNKQGLKVSRIEPAHYTTAKDDTVLTYDVYAEVPAQLITLQKSSWQPAEPDLRRFTNVLVLNTGLPAGQQWNTQNPSIAAEAGTKLNFAWKVHWDKTYKIVDTDKLPLSEGVFTQQQVAQYQDESTNTVAALRGQIQQIDAEIQQNTQQKLAQVPADPAKPQMLSSKFGGDGSGEPTKSAERIGGGTLAGAAGGAAFGAAAGDAGLGAGIGAGVGLLGGLIYDGVSKSNDRKKHERAVASENEERMDNWRDEIRSLKKQRSAIQQDALAERDHALDDLAAHIQANGGKPEGAAPTTVTETPPVEPVPAVTQPTADQPSGPITANTLSPSSGNHVPVSAAVIKKPNSEFDWGNIQVTYSDGQTQMVSTDGRSYKPEVSTRGIIGWVYTIGYDQKFGREKENLKLLMPDGSTKNFEPSQLYITQWGFADNERSVVINSMEHHGHAYFIKYSIANGQTLEEVNQYEPHDQLPAWAQPFDHY